MRVEAKVGERLRQLRDASGKSRARLAKDAGVSYAFIQQLETGARSMPRGDNLAHIASALGVTIDELLQDAEPTSLVGPANYRDERADLMSSIEILCSRLDLSTLATVRHVIEGFTKIGTRSSDQSVASAGSNA
jgi:transcriptional regulator with XRE-family HTH domain